MMPFLGTIINFFVVLICGVIGTLIKRGVPKRISDAIMSAMGICVVYIGIDGALEAAPAITDGALLSNGLVKVLVMILSMGLGALIGELIDIDKWINKLGDTLEAKFAHSGEKGNFARGFVACSILYCVGAMAVNGAFQDAFGKPDIIIAKSVLDGFSCIVMASTLGIGCAFSAFFVLLYQGAFTLLGLVLNGVLPSYSITYMSVTGSLIIILIGTNLLGITRIKTANLLPAIFLPMAIAPLLALILGA